MLLTNFTSIMWHISGLNRMLNEGEKCGEQNLLLYILIINWIMESGHIYSCKLVKIRIIIVLLLM